MTSWPRMYFFFSSRRRHTRFDCDWSSDVCSSDLPDRRRRRGFPGRAAVRRVHVVVRSEEHTSELQSQSNLVCRLLLEKKKKNTHHVSPDTSTTRTQSLGTKNVHLRVCSYVCF